MLHEIRRLFRDDRGQATTEYILILSVAVLIATKLRGTMSTRMKMVSDALFNQIDDAIKVPGE